MALGVFAVLIPLLAVTVSAMTDSPQPLADKNESGVANGTTKTEETASTPQPITEKWFSQMFLDWKMPLPPEVSKLCQKHVYILVERMLTVDPNVEGAILEWWSNPGMDGKLGSPRGALNTLFVRPTDFGRCVDVDVPSTTVQPNKTETTSADFVGTYCFVMRPRYVLRENATVTPGADPPPKDMIGTFRTGICLPSSCNEDDEEIMVNYLLSPGDFFIDKERISCTPKTGPTVDPTTAIIGYVLLAIVVIALLATAVDILGPRLTGRYRFNWNKTEGCSLMSFLLMFSAPRSFKSIFFDSKQSENKFQFIEGMRFFSMLIIILYHSILIRKALTLRLSDIPRKIEKREVYGYETVELLCGALAVDTFFYLSGFCAVFFSSQSKPRFINPVLEMLRLLVKRIVRLTPTLAVALAYACGPMRHLGNGPFWAISVHHSKTCRYSWWKELLYISNNLNNCLPSWYLAVDMQLYLLVPFMLLIARKTRWIFRLILLLILVAIIIRGVYAIKEDLDVGAIHLLHLEPWMRAAPYLVGAFTGFLIHSVGPTDTWIKPKFVCLGWTLCAVISLYLAFWRSIFHLLDAKVPSALYQFMAIFTSTLWGLNLTWITIRCSISPAGPVTKFLSWKLFTCLGRLTYCLYLTHMLVQENFYYRTWDPQSLTEYQLVNVFLSTSLISIGSAIVLYMLVEYPSSYFKFTFTRWQKTRSIERHESQVPIEVCTKNEEAVGLLQNSEY